MLEKFYGRRKGKALKPGRVILMEKLLPQVSLKIPNVKKKGYLSPDEVIEELHKEEVALECLNMQDFFPEKKDDFCLEVGFGGGEHIAEMALRSPKTGFLGAEVFVNGVAHLLALIGQVNQDKSVSFQKGRVDNLRIFHEDVRLLFPLLKREVFSQIYVLFPDPWPKTRHEKRRFIGPKNLPVLASLLKKGGELIVATDVPLYAEWTESKVQESHLFELKNKEVRIRPKDWIPTRYEEKGIKAGRNPYYFVFTKK